jgi:hypothetical protein
MLAFACSVQQGQRSAQRGREKGNASLDAGPLRWRSRKQRATLRAGRSARAPTPIGSGLEHSRHRLYKRGHSSGIAQRSYTEPWLPRAWHECCSASSLDESRANAAVGCNQPGIRRTAAA